MESKKAKLMETESKMVIARSWGLEKMKRCLSKGIAALFTIAKTWKQCKYPSIDEWIKKMWYVYTVEYYSAIKKNEIMPLTATWMDLEIIILSEASQTQILYTI